MYNPRDKVLVHNFYNDLYVTGSFCTYDGHNLRDSVLIGKKLTCGKCGSSYSIETGTVENGPALRNISAFPIDVDRKENMLYVFLPKEQIPPYGKQKIVPKAENHNETYVIIGDTLTTLGAITALRSNYNDKILIIPNGNIRYGYVCSKLLVNAFTSKNVRMHPIENTDRFGISGVVDTIVDDDFLEKNY